MIDVKQVRNMVTLFETGTVTGAAEKLHMTQPTLTTHLHRLESLLGEQLFIRSSKGLEPTPMGKSFYQRGKAMLENWRVFDQEISLLAGAELGEVRVVCGAVIEQEVLPNAIVQFLQEHSLVNLQVEVINPDRMQERLMSGDAEVAVGAFSDIDKLAVEQVEAGAQQIGFYVRPGHPLLERSNNDSDLKGFPLAGPQVPLNILNWLEKQGFSFTQQRLLSDSYKLLKQVAMCSDLTVGGPQFVFLNEVAAGDMVQLPIQNAPVWRPSILIARPARHSKVVRGFVQCVRQELLLKTAA